MRILVFGKTGQLGSELACRATAGIRIAALGRDEADLSDPEGCAAAIGVHDVDAVINAAAGTAVDRLEEEEEAAELTNGEAPAAMARAAAAKGVPFLHVSTDYVFDGSGERPWKPDDEAGPLGAYGRTKLQGEKGVREAGGAHAILRTSWVFSAHGGNFVKTMLRLGKDGSKLDIVADQVGGPTSAADIADALLAMAAAFHRGEGRSGTYHFSGAPDVSWADFAREIFAQAGRQVAVRDIPSSERPSPTKRPANSRLDCASLQADYGIIRPDWRKSLASVLRELDGR